MFASKAIGGRPVKWVEGRRENYQSTIHGRDHITYLEIAGNARRRGHRPAGQDVRQPRRPAVDDRPGHPDHALRPGPRRAATRSRTSTARSPASTRTRRSSTPIAAPAGPRRRTSSSGRWTSSPTRSGMDPAAVRRKNFIPPDAFPYDNPSGLRTAVNGAKIYIDSGNYEPALNKALTMVGYYELRREEGGGEAARQAPGRRPVDLHRGLRRRAVQVDRRGRRGLGRGDVGVGEHQGPPDRQGRRHDGHPAAGPGPRDDLRADHRPRAGRADGGHRRPALRHPGHAVRLRLVRLADLERGQTAAIKAAGKIKEKARRYAAHMLEASAEDIEVDGAEYRVKGSPDKVKTIQEIAFALDLAFDAAGGHGAVPRRDGLPRHAELHVPVRDAHRDRRDRRGDRRRSTSCATSRSTTSARRSTR